MLARRRRRARSVRRRGPGLRGAGTQPSWSAYQALRLLSPETLLARILADLGASSVSDAGNAFAEEVAARPQPGSPPSGQ